MKILRPRNLVAVAVTTGILVLSGLPAAANTANVEIYDPAGADTPGVLVLLDAFGGGGDTIALSAAGGTCSSTGVSVGINTTAPSIISFNTRGQFRLSGTGPLYQANLVVTNAPKTGSWTGGTGFAVNGVTFQATISTDSNSNCVVDGTDATVCDLDITVDTAGTYSGSHSAAAVNDTLKLDVFPSSNGDVITSSSGCNSPFASYLDGTVDTISTGGDDVDLKVISVV